MLLFYILYSLAGAGIVGWYRNSLGKYSDEFNEEEIVRWLLWIFTFSLWPLAIMFGFSKSLKGKYKLKLKDSNIERERKMLENKKLALDIKKLEQEGEF